MYLLLWIFLLRFFPEPIQERIQVSTNTNLPNLLLSSMYHSVMISHLLIRQRGGWELRALPDLQDCTEASSWTRFHCSCLFHGQHSSSQLSESPPHADRFVLVVALSSIPVKNNPVGQFIVSGQASSYIIYQAMNWLVWFGSGIPWPHICKIANYFFSKLTAEGEAPLSKKEH